MGISNLTAENREEILIQPNEGELKRLYHFDLSLDVSTATSGDITLNFYLGDTTASHKILLSLQADYNQQYLRLYHLGLNSGEVVYPNYLAGTSLSNNFYYYLQNYTKYDFNTPLTVQILNNSDVSLTVNNDEIKEEVMG